MGSARHPYKIVGEVLAGLRQQAGLSPEELAQRADRTAAFIRSLEAGDARFRWGDVFPIARGLGITAEELFRRLEEAGA